MNDTGPEECSQTETIMPRRGHAAMPRDTSDRFQPGEGANGTSSGEDMDVTKHPMCSGQAPTIKNYLATKMSTVPKEPDPTVEGYSAN